MTKRPPKFLACGQSFYGPESYNVDGYERKLSQIESDVAPILRSIVQNKSTHFLDKHDCIKIADFISAQSFRTESFQAGLSIVDRKNFLDIIERLWESRLLAVADIIDRPYILMKTTLSDPYYIGDHPVTFQNTEDTKSHRSLGFLSKGIEAFLPITPTLALYLPCSSTCKYIVDGYEDAKNFLLGRNSSLDLGKASLYHFNRIMVSQATKVLIKSQKLYDSIVNGDTFIADRDNVINFNYLQCVYASSSVMSYRKEFSLADRIFSEHPDLREPPKVTLLSIG